LNPISVEHKKALVPFLQSIIAKKDSSGKGYAHFYRLIFGRELPPHAKKDWVPLLEKGIDENIGVIIEAFRGASKTTSITLGWLAFQIGHHPEKSNLLIQASDQIARDNAQQIADIIAHNPGWRLIFPTVIPDRKIGWGHDRYEVKRTDLPYPEWRAICAKEKGKDATLVGLGYQSRAIIGKHPSGILMVDDIHDEQNTASAAQLSSVQQILTGTILPTLNPQTKQIFIGTPWVENDVLAYLKSTGLYHHTKTPIQKEVNGVITATWANRFSLAEIEIQRKLSGEVEFARMYLLDLSAASGVYLKREWLIEYPYQKIEPDWPIIMGVDYASTADQQNNTSRDYFTIAIGRALPGGAGMVLIDGFRGRVSQGEAEEKLKYLAGQYPSLQLIGVEAVGKGEEFFHLMLRTSRLPLQPFHTGRASKGQRFERGMAPLFQHGRAFISDVETSFIRSFKSEWIHWPKSAHDDTLDAVYWMLNAGLPHLFGSTKNKQTHHNPFTQLSRK
jgi:hypothetical protein